MTQSKKVDFFIFDLGNVIIDIDYSHTFRLLKELLDPDLHFKVDKFYLTDFHKAYEKGLINSDQFRVEVNTYFEQDWSPEKVDEVWNSLLGKIPSYRMDLLKKLSQSHRIGILSNTNEIHIEAVNKLLQQDFGMDSFWEISDYVYYSHEMGLAKPSEEIYEEMLRRLQTTADRVVFFDDLAANVAGAKKVGIEAIQVTSPQVIIDYFQHV